MTIYNLKKGESAVIVNIDAQGRAAARLAALGFTTGKEVIVLGYSLFKSSVLIGCGSVRLAVRKSIADKIEVQR